jgi:hypothetical protein
VTVRVADGTCLKFLDAMNYAPPQTLDSFVKTFGDKKNLQKGVFAYDGFNSSNYMSILNKTVPFEQQDFHSNLKNLDISDEEYKAYLEDWKEKGFETRWDYLKHYNINDVMIMISPIDNLIAMFYKWGMDMLSNITLASNAQCMKFKMLYDKYKRAKPLIRSNQPIIPYHSYEQKSRTIEYDSDEEEDVNEIGKLFKNTFIKHFDKDELKKKEDEVVEGFKSLNVYPEVYLPTLTDEEKEELEKKHYVISKQSMIDKSRSCWGKIIR